MAEKKSQKREYAKRQKRIKTIRENEIRQQEKDMSIAERWTAHAKAAVEHLETADEAEIKKQRFRESMLQHDISRHVDGRASRLSSDTSHLRTGVHFRGNCRPAASISIQSFRTATIGWFSGGPLLNKIWWY